MDKETKEKFFRELYDEAYGKLHTFLDRKQEDESNVEDVIQETFLEAYSKMDSLMDHPNRMGWLYITAKNKAMKMRNRKEFCCLDDKPADFVEDVKSGTAEYRKVELSEVIKAYVSEEDYRMFCDYYVNGYSSMEIADKYGLSMGNFRMRMSRMKKKLRENIFAGVLVLALYIWNLL